MDQLSIRKSLFEWNAFARIVLKANYRPLDRLHNTRVIQMKRYPARTATTRKMNKMKKKMKLSFLFIFNDYMRYIRNNNVIRSRPADQIVPLLLQYT